MNNQRERLKHSYIQPPDPNITARVMEKTEARRRNNLKQVKHTIS